MKSVLVVGAGFAGAVYARSLAEAGFQVQVIDRRAHIGGNAYDFCDRNGVRVHAYGPHLFHTKNSKIVDWLKQFGDFRPYLHEVRGLLSDGRHVPIPINIDTVNSVFDVRIATAEGMADFLKSIATTAENPRNAAEYLHSRIGVKLADLFFRPYTKKMWNIDLEDLSADVVKRIPLKFDKSRTYFDDAEIQMMPVHGYTELFYRIFEHPNIHVNTSVEFDKIMAKDYDFCFNSMAIDEYYDYCFGELPYRSIRFHHAAAPLRPSQSWAVTNFTDESIITRETAWHVIPFHLVTETGFVTYTQEEPCDYRENNYERYYPIKSADGCNQRIYERYRDHAAKTDTKLSFIGRCGTYQYLDMDQVINQSMQGASHWLSKYGRDRF